MLRRYAFLLVLSALAFGGCGDDGGTTDTDSGVDSDVDGDDIDGGDTDGGALDGGDTDAGDLDGGDLDGGDTDGGDLDGSTDGAVADGGTDSGIDAGPIGGGADTSVQLQAVIDADTDVALTLDVDMAIITYVKSAIGNDPAGVFVQAEQMGPAVFVPTDGLTFTTAPAVGQVVTFDVTMTSLVNGAVHVTGLENWTVDSTDNDVAWLAQDLSAATDVVSALDSYSLEYVTITGTLTEDPSSAGTGFVAADIDTAGSTGDQILVRMPGTADFPAIVGCGITVGPVPMWRYNTTPQTSVEDVTTEITIDSCPAPMTTGALQFGTTIVVYFDQVIDAATAATSFSGTPTSITVEGTSAILTYDTAPATVTVSGVSSSLGFAMTADEPVTPVARTAATPNVIISAYVDPTSGTAKLIQLANLGATATELAGCTLNRYTNGSTSATTIVDFDSDVSGFSLASNALYGICSNAAVTDTVLGTFCDLEDSGVTHNGDDALTLECGGVVIDSFGSVGEDPGTNWYGGGVSSRDQVLTRRCFVNAGDTVADDTFHIDWEWKNEGADAFAAAGNFASCLP